MGKSSSIILYVTVAALVLVLISHNNKPPEHRHRRLKIRSNFTFTPPLNNKHHDPTPFDPLVAEIERKREDREYFHSQHQSAPGHESQPEWEDFMDAEDYLNDEERFNVTNRLVVLFPRIDVDPPDGFVTEKELSMWNVQQSQKEVLHRTEREMGIHDKNKDGFLSFNEYHPPTWAGADNNSFEYDMGWWKEEHFNASDVDDDGLLNITEFNDFLHPADTNNPKLLHWLCKEEVRERDRDKDGKVNFKEFFHGLFDLVRNYAEEDHNSSHESDDSNDVPAKNLFNQLDRDDDGYLSETELLPIIGKLHPSEHYYATQQTEYIMQQYVAGVTMSDMRIKYDWDDEADTDKDGRLTLTEMIDSPYVFYSAVFNEDDDGDYGYHDEFR